MGISSPGVPEVVQLAGLDANGTLVGAPVSVLGGLSVTLGTKLSGEDQANDRMMVIAPNASFSAARGPSAVTLGSAGAIGDYLERVVLTSAATTATLTVSDANGTVLASFRTTDPVGTVREVHAKAAGAGFRVDLHASGVGAVTAIGLFT